MQFDDYNYNNVNNHILIDPTGKKSISSSCNSESCSSLHDSDPINGQIDTNIALKDIVR